MSERAVRVFVADDHPSYRDDVSRAISGRPGLELAGAAGDGLRALDGIRRTRPEVAVLAVGLAGLGGIDVTAQLVREEAPGAVLLLSTSPEDVYEAIVAGAVGHLMRGARAEHVCAAVEAVARGERVLAPEAQAALIDCIRGRARTARAVLTEREHEVLCLTADGLSSPQIGAALHLSPTTVKSHLHRAYEKLGVSDRAAAVAVAMRSGLLE